MIFLRRLWKIVAVNEAITVSRLTPVWESHFWTTDVNGP
jgi:hypothetical protein